MAGRRRIMVIDDSELFLEAARGVLEKAGYDVVTRSKALGSGVAILQDQPDVVLLDVSMPALNGSRLLETIRRSPRIGQTPVLLFSAKPEAELRELCEKHGATGYICKTPQLRDLAEQMERWLSGQRTAELKPRVLFVDDSPIILELYKSLFEDDLRADYVDSAADAWERIRGASPPAVVICDLHMPTTSGLELYEKAQALDRGWRARFIFLTGRSDDHRYSSALDDISVPVLKKPPMPGQVLTAIKNIPSW